MLIHCVRRVLCNSRAVLSGTRSRKLHTSTTNQNETSSNSDTSESDEEIFNDESDTEQYSKSAEFDQLYPGHIPLTTFQRYSMGVLSGIACLLDPARDDMIATFGETTGLGAVEKMRAKMLANKTGRLILEEKPRINSKTVDLEYLKQLPKNTFGYKYREFLDINQVTPDSRRPVAFIDDIELAYVMQRYREIHDLTHTLLGMPTNMLGEVAVKWVEAYQTELPLCSYGAFFGPLRYRPKFRERYLSVYLPWALQVGRNAECLMNVYFEKHWEDDINEMRKQLKVANPPPLKT